jgi:hypothetical protein
MANFQTQRCLQCNKGLSGRSDKKFCDAHCRNSYNNQHKASHELYIRQVNQIIRYNRRILQQLSPQGKTIVRREVAEAMGFNLDHFTGLFKSSASWYYMCYDYGYRAIVERGIEKLQIIQQQDYMANFDPWKHISAS